MGDRTKIEWSDATWNPVTGCVEVSPGCDHCYAKTFAERWRGVAGHPYENGFDVTLRPERLDQPLKWRKPRLVFVNSMSDLFHEAIPDDYIARVFAVMAATPRHTYQVLTKRHGRMRSLLRSEDFRAKVGWRMEAAGELGKSEQAPWPLPNVWLGVSVEDQKWADVRIPALKETPAAVRFLSCEPLLGPVERLYLGESAMAGVCVDIDGAWWHPPGSCPHCSPGLDWVIVGGESGHGARPMHPLWARQIRYLCEQANVPFLFKQWGEWKPVPVEVDPEFAGGHAFDHPLGGRQAVVIRERSTQAFVSGATRMMEPGDETRGGVRCLDDTTVAVRVGKHNAGRELDGRTYDGYPAGAR